uniref:Uncharacterized protein n=1 Tax=Alexandrium monilatum TaxID=311494 RepID=A0A7S4Q313_9DINO
MAQAILARGIMSSAALSRGRASGSHKCQRLSSSLPCRRCGGGSAPRGCCRGASLRGHRPRGAAQRPAARKCLACEFTGDPGDEDLQRAGELSRRSAQALARGLLRAGGRHPEGFEDDPITYVEVGRCSGRLPAAAEAEISGRLCSIFREDVSRLLRQEEGKREELTRQAVESWSRRKRAERFLRAEHSTAEFVKAHLRLDEPVRGRR